MAHLNGEGLEVCIDPAGHRVLVTCQRAGTVTIPDERRVMRHIDHPAVTGVILVIQMPFCLAVGVAIHFDVLPVFAAAITWTIGDAHDENLCLQPTAFLHNRHIP